MKWSVPRWLPVPKNAVQSLARFSTLPIPLQMSALMMSGIGESVLCGKHWSYASTSSGISRQIHMATDALLRYNKQQKPCGEIIFS